MEEDFESQFNTRVGDKRVIWEYIGSYKARKVKRRVGTVKASGEFVPGEQLPIVSSITFTNAVCGKTLERVVFLEDFKLDTQKPARVEGLLIAPTPFMTSANCDGCHYKHRPSSSHCSANITHGISPLRPGFMYNTITHAIICRYTITETSIVEGRVSRVIFNVFKVSDV